MGLVLNRMNYSLWSGKRSIKQPDEYDTYKNETIPGSQSDENGILAFATASQQVLVCNWNTGQMQPEGSDMSKMYQTCMDFAPFLFQHKIPDAERVR